MTYVICVNRPGFLPEMEPYEVESLADAKAAAHEEVSFTEARGIARAELTLQIERLPEDGGVIGPLPDGYVIDVLLGERVYGPVPLPGAPS